MNFSKNFKFLSNLKISQHFHKSLNYFELKETLILKSTRTPSLLKLDKTSLVTFQERQVAIGKWQEATNLIEKRDEELQAIFNNVRKF